MLPGPVLVAIMPVMCQVKARRPGLQPTGQAFAWGAVRAEIVLVLPRLAGY